jgi:Lon-like ATP-dependent protease
MLRLGDYTNPILVQIYRKAAYKIVSDLGESALPEPQEVEGGKEGSVEAQNPDVKPPSERLPGDEAPASGESAVKKTTTKPRKPMKVPSSVHVKVTKDNLKDYVGPAVYHKDRLYVKAPPAGVSTGLGYLGNGSGAVMPIEATVRADFQRVFSASDIFFHSPCQARAIFS